MQELAHVLAISQKNSASMREVNYITVTDLARTINRDLMLMVGKRPATLITTFITKRGRKGNLDICVHLRIFNKLHAPCLVMNN